MKRPLGALGGSHGRTQVTRDPARRRAYGDAQLRLAGRLRELRLAGGITQDALAEQAGLHPKKISILENAGTNATLKTLAGLAVALKVDIAELLSRPTAAPRPGTRAPQRPRRRR